MANFWTICTSAKEANLHVVFVNANNSFEFRADKTHMSVAHMVRYGKGWKGFCGAETFAGTKNKVAQWCVDTAEKITAQI